VNRRRVQPVEPSGRFLPRLGLIAALLLLPPQAGALLNIDGSRNQIFVFGGVSFGYSSNIFAEANGRGDYSMSANAGLELKRRAGIIAVNGTARVSYIRYGEYTQENNLNPSFSVELNKTGGRTTGAFTVSAYRETRSDSAVNLRTSTWNFPLGLNLKYPINDNLYVTSNTGYLSRNYTDHVGLVDYTDWSEAVDLFYVYSSKLDLIGGYRIRLASTSVGGRTADHWFNVGATGGLFAKLNGTVRVGYQFRQTRGGAGQDYDQLNASASVSWPITRKFFLGFSVNRDFNTIATGASVDSSSAAVRATYSYTRKLEFGADAAVGHNKFLGADQFNRQDTFFSWSLNGFYSPNEHLRLSASYSYFRNWSSLGFSDYDSHGFSVDISSRY